MLCGMMLFKFYLLVLFKNSVWDSVNLLLSCTMIQAVKNWLKQYVSGTPDKAYWRPKDKLTPRTNLGTTHSAMYTRYAVKPPRTTEVY